MRRILDGRPTLWMIDTEEPACAAFHECGFQMIYDYKSEAYMKFLSNDDALLIADFPYNQISEYLDQGRTSGMKIIFTGSFPTQSADRFPDQNKWLIDMIVMPEWT